MKVLIGSKNPAKIEGARQAFNEYYENVEISGISVDSGVSDQPVNTDILLGAKNRVNALIEYAKNNNISADYYIAIESGITNSMGNWMIVNVAAVSDGKRFSYSTSAGFPVPEKYVASIISYSLGGVMDKLYNETNVGSRGGGVSILTQGKISRIDLTKDAFIMALTQFVDEKWRD